MSTSTETGARPVAAAATRLAQLRRTSFLVLVVILIEFGLGMYVNLYVTVPKADHGANIGSLISNGPGILSAHLVVGLVLGLGAISALIEAIRSRHVGAIIAAALGLGVLAAADGTGASFTTAGGHAADSMVMAILTAVALLCYGLILYAVRPPAQSG